MLEITGNFPAAKKEKRREERSGEERRGEEPTCCILLWGFSKSESAFCNSVALSKDGPENCACTSLELCFSHIKLPLFLLILREVTVCFADPEVNKLKGQWMRQEVEMLQTVWGCQHRARCCLLLIALRPALGQSLGC